MQVDIRAATLAAFAIVAAPVPALAWDYVGHRIVGEIADIVLQRDHPDTYKLLRESADWKDVDGKSIGERSLSDVAVYPDCAKNEPQYCGRRPSLEEIDYVLRNLVHKSFHFTNSPLGQTTYRAGGVGTLETDVVQMLIHVIKQLDGQTPSRKREVRLTKAEAIWVLAHLVGDLHQPLHVGQIYFDTTCNGAVDPNDPKTKEYLSTFGGNLISLKPPAGADNLHFYWDGAAVVNAMRAEGLAGNEVEFARKLAAAPPTTGWAPSGDPETWPGQWFSEAMPIAKEAHEAFGLKIKGEVGKPPVFPSATVSCRWSTTIPAAYHDWAKGHARAQLHKAGYRLAALLKAVLGP
jgi:S1/P1 nuclease